MLPAAGGSTTPKDEWRNLSSQATGNLAFDSVENIYGDYSRTLRIWGENFLGTLHDRIAPALRIENLGMSGEEVKVFKRKWEVNTFSSASSLSLWKCFQDWHDKYELVPLYLLRGRVQSQDPELHYPHHSKRMCNGAI